LKTLNKNENKFSLKKNSDRNKNRNSPFFYNIKEVDLVKDFDFFKEKDHLNLNKNLSNNNKLKKN
jgi:hypothetical protein